MKKILLRTLKIIFGLLILFILSVVAPGFIPGCSKSDKFFIKDAQFDSTDFIISTDRILGLDPQNTIPVHLVQLHRLRKGSGTILGIRDYSPGMLWTHDDEYFRKITLWISDLREGNFNTGNSDIIKAYYTQGGSAWPQSNCGGSLDGNFTISKLSESRLRLVIDAIVDCRSPYKNDQKTILINEEWTLKVLDFDKVTPWIGKWDSRIYRETYR